MNACKIRVIWDYCQTQIAIVTSRKLSSKTYLKSDENSFIEQESHICRPPPHDVNAALNGAGVAGVADLLRAASLLQCGHC